MPNALSICHHFFADTANFRETYVSNVRCQPLTADYRCFIRCHHLTTVALFAASCDADADYVAGVEMATTDNLSLTIAADSTTGVCNSATSVW